MNRISRSPSPRKGSGRFLAVPAVMCALALSAEVSGQPYTPYNQTSEHYDVDGIIYKDVYGTAARNFSDPAEVYKRFLNGYTHQLPAGTNTPLTTQEKIYETKYGAAPNSLLGGWMNAGKMSMPLDSDMLGFVHKATGYLSLKKPLFNKNEVLNDERKGTLTMASSIAGAASAMMTEFNTYKGYSVGDRVSVLGKDIGLSGIKAIIPVPGAPVPKVSLPNDLAALTNSEVVLWSLDRVLIGLNEKPYGSVNNDDGRKAFGGYSYIGTGLIFYDFKLHYLETGKEFYSAASGFNGDISVSVNKPGFTLNPTNALNSMSSRIRNEGSQTASSDVTWTNTCNITFTNEVSSTNGYKMSHMTGIYSTNTTTQSKTNTYSVGAKVSLFGMFSAGGDAKHTNYWSNTQKTEMHNEMRTENLFQLTESASSSTSDSKTNSVNTKTGIPPHTEVMLTQNETRMSMTLNYDYPVTISYKVKVIGIGARRLHAYERIDDTRDTVTAMRQIATFGYEGTGALPEEMDAMENFHKRYENRFTAGYKTLHSADTISLERMWTEIKRRVTIIAGATVARSEVFWDRKNFSDNGDESMLEKIFLFSAEKWKKLKPMTVTSGTMTYSSKAVESEISGYRPLYRLKTIEANVKSVDIIKDSPKPFYVGDINLEARNTESVLFDGFHKEKGVWRLTDANGGAYTGPLAALKTEAGGTGRQILETSVADKGTVYLRYAINDNTYTYGNLTGYMSAGDVEQTAVVPVHVNRFGVAITEQPVSTVKGVSAETYRISVGVAADGVNVKYQWYVNTVAKNDGGLPIPGATAPFYEAPLGTLGVFHYYVVITANEEVVSFASLPASVSVVKPSAGWFDPQATRHTISTAEELAVLAAIVNGTAEGIEKYNFFGDTVTLAADIDLSGYAAGEGWMPIGWELWDYDVSYNDGFLGVFDGGGHIISNLTINRPNAKYQGLFGVIGQTSRVINLGLEKVSVTGKQFVGGVAGIARGYNGQGSSEIGQSLIRNSYSTGTVTGSYSVGGITGNAMAGRIYDSHFSGTVSGDSLVGGIVGSNGVILINNYSTGTVSGTGNYVGGIMGGGSGGVVENCYSTAAVSGANNVGGLVGMITTRGGTVINSAALNIEVKSAGTNVGRVVGMIGSGTEWSSRVEGNTAFNGITSIYQSAVWLNVGADKRDGADISVSDIRSDGTIGGLFLAENGWTAEDGKLPGIGAVVALPKHLGGDTPVKHTVSGQRSAQYVKLAGRSLNLRLAGKGSVSVFALNGARVRKVDLAKGSHTLRMNDLPRGVYMVRVHSGAWKQSVRMLVK